MLQKQQKVFELSEEPKDRLTFNYEKILSYTKFSVFSQMCFFLKYKPIKFQLYLHYWLFWFCSNSVCLWQIGKLLMIFRLKYNFFRSLFFSGLMPWKKTKCSCRCQFTFILTTKFASLFPDKPKQAHSWNPNHHWKRRFKAPVFIVTLLTYS